MRGPTGGSKEGEPEVGRTTVPTRWVARATRTAATVGALAASTLAGHRAVTAQEVVEVPLELTAGRLTVSVSTADGDDMTFFVSTGSAVTVLSESAARRVAEVQGGDDKGRAGGGRARAAGEARAGAGARVGSDARALDLAGVMIPLDGARTVPDDRLTWDGVAFDGIVGVSTLNRFDLLVDVAGGRMLLRPPGPSTDWPGMTLSEPARVRVYHGVVIGLDVEIDDRSYAAMLDLGTPGLVVSDDVTLPDGVVVRNDAVVADPASDEGGTVSLDVGTGEAIDAPARVGDIAMLDRWDPNGAGFALVGAVIARDCALSLSWVHREIRRCVG